MPTPLVRLLLVAGIAASLCSPILAARAAAQTFGFESVVALARDLAAAPYAAPAEEVSDRLSAADYDSYRKIRFRGDRALWRDECRFEVQFFHPGFLFRTPVEMNIVENGQSSPLPFDAAMFDYGGTGLDAADAAPHGFAGFRLHYPLNAVDYKDEVIVFLGASYFRVLGREQLFGLSARGLAVDTAMPRGEEFPVFRTFWLVKPAAADTHMTIYALLDGPRVAGANRFVVEPGTDTRVRVTARLFARADVDKIGIAPLTSMYLYGENQVSAFDDFRPEVHDSDGLLMRTGSGRWLWRPLLNPKELRVSYFVDRDPRGFGLFQRDRRFASYQDTESHYDQRPSYWVEPVDGWGEGGIELVEIPSTEEINDNVVAYWRPREPLSAGDDRTFSYVLSAALRMPHDLDLGQVVDTRIGSARVPGTGEAPSLDRRRFVVDFAGGDLPYLGDRQPVVPDFSHSAGTVRDLTVTRLPENDVWRVSFLLDMKGADTVELALTLRLDDAPVTETWLYRVAR